LIKFLNHSILTPDNARQLITTAKEYKETRQIADMLSDVKPEVQEEEKKETTIQNSVED
jgi:hypothetical protein